MIEYSILVPTRARPSNMKRLCNSVFSTASNPESVEVIFYIDDDDLESITAAEELKLNHNIKYFTGERIVLSQMWNKCYDLSSGNYLMLCCDECIFHTTDWDKTVLDKFAEFDDKIAFVYGNDLNMYLLDDKFGVYGFLHRNWTTTVGYFVPPYFSSDFNDTWLNDVAKKIGRHFFIPIITEHMHPGAGKAQLDRTHMERLARHKADGVENKYYSLEHERERDAKKLKNFINNYKKQ